MLFPEGLKSAAEFAQFADELRKTHPHAFLMANMTEFGQSPLLPKHELQQMGYHAAIYPVTALRAAMKAVMQVYDALMQKGSVAGQTGQMLTRSELYKLLRYDPSQLWFYPRNE